MKTIIAGSRDITDYETVRQCIAQTLMLWHSQDKNRVITEVVSGGCGGVDPKTGKTYGVDSLGEKWGVSMKIPVVVFPADWKKYGIRAGHIRNEKMAKYADALIAIKKPISKGTEDMIKRATEKKLLVFVHVVEDKK